LNGGGKVNKMQGAGGRTTNYCSRDHSNCSCLVDGWFKGDIYQMDGRLEKPHTFWTKKIQNKTSTKPECKIRKIHKTN
jgi:hypothetical protein